MAFSSVFHPTDLTEGSFRAFEHALRIALSGKSSLRVLHVGSEERPPWKDYPGVRETLQQWGKLPEDCSKTDVMNLGLTPSKYFLRTEDPASAIVKDAKQQGSDLIVMATRAPQGLQRLLSPSLARPVSRRSKLPTLLVPHGVRGFVDSGSGECRLSRVLLLIGPPGRPAEVVTAAASLATTLEVRPVAFRLFYVGPEWEMPRVKTPEVPGWSWERVARGGGKPYREIRWELEEFQPDLLVLQESRHDGVWETLLGGTVERILGRAPCPVLVVHAA